MAQVKAFLQIDADHAPEQIDFLRSRVTVLREAGGQFWVAMEEAYVDTFVSQNIEVTIVPEADVLHVGPLVYRPATETPQPPEALRASVPAGGRTAFWIVHFVAPIDKSWLQEIVRAGAAQVHPLNGFSAVFQMTLAASDAVRSLAYVDSVGLFHPAYAVSLDLTGVREPFTASSLSGLRLQFPASTTDENLQVQFFDGIKPEAIRAALEGTGVTVVAGTYNGFMLACSQEQLKDVLRIPGILSASTPAEKGFKVHNAGVILGANQVRDLGTVDFLVDLDGQGEIGAVVDSGFDVGNLLGGLAGPVMTPFHPDLVNCFRLLRNSRAPLIVSDVPDLEPHGTHVAGIIAGSGASSGGMQRGMAPGAALVGLGKLPTDIKVTFGFASANGARVINNSWGATYPTGSYSLADALPLDEWCYRNPDVLLVFAAGNSERDTNLSDGRLDARTLTQQSTAKNVFTVGASENLRNDGGWRDTWRAYFPSRYNHPALNSLAGGAPQGFTTSDNADHLALFSDRGDVLDDLGVPTGRIKPDLVAPGVNILSCRSQLVAPQPLPPGLPTAYPSAVYDNLFDSILPSGLNRDLYHIISGTSMATPMVTGAALLVRQYYRTRFAQMRRPLLLEGVAIPAAAPLPVFGNPPVVSSHADGLVCAWITPALPTGQKNIAAMRLGRHLAPVDGRPVHLQDNVGEHPAPKIVTVGERIYLLHRHNDNKMRLSCYDRRLRPVPEFGTAGVVVLSPEARPDDGTPPDLIAVGDQLACVFPSAGGNGYFFQRFRADTGAAVDGAAIGFLAHDGTGPHHSLTWNGARFTVCGVAHPGNFQLQVRQMDASGNVQGTNPVTVLDQAPEIREPSLLWDPRSSRYALVWCDARAVPGGELWLQFLNADANPQGAAQRVVTVPAANHLRRPKLCLHHDSGYALVWEDDSQNARFDLYLSFLDANGAVDGRIAADATDVMAPHRRLVRLSDTPLDTAGFAVLSDANGFVVVYQSPDEINSDRLGIYALNLTRSGAFEAQADPSTPMLKSGRYVTAKLLDHGSVLLTALSAAWTGGSYYLVRLAHGAGKHDNLQWVRLHADGAVDTTYRIKGVLQVPSYFMILACESLWTENHLITAVTDVMGKVTLHLHDARGTPVANFGAGGAVTLHDPVTVNARIRPQIGFVAKPFQTIVAYGTTQGGVLQLRQQRVNSRGVQVGSPVNLAAADGVAAHNWFQFVTGEDRSIAIYHRVNGPDTRVHCRRFKPDGTPEGAENDVSAPQGEAINGVLARRPSVIDPLHPEYREYGAAWQYRANAASRWELRFSRLNRDGQAMAHPPGTPTRAPAGTPSVSDWVVIGAATPGWSATRDAVEPQLISTYTHEPWADNPPAGVTVPEWSPSYGLAWIGVEADGSRVLYFTVLDENGRRIPLPQPPPRTGPLSPPSQAGILQVSATGTRVRDFKLVWNGRVFLLNWVEEENGNLHHKCTLVNRHGNHNANEIPSAALIRATLVNGATNITSGPLPDLAAGYGWGRVNLRQSLSPAPPVTLHVRDDCAIGPGRKVTYHFTLPPGTALLRVTLNWTDPPGPRLVNHLHLTVRAPARRRGGTRPEYRGNLWSTVPGQTHLSRSVTNRKVDRHEDFQTFKQVVLANPVAGIYEVEVFAAAFASHPLNQQNLQPFALVFAGTGPEVRFSQSVAAVAGTAVY